MFMFDHYHDHYFNIMKTRNIIMDTMINAPRDPSNLDPAVLKFARRAAFFQGMCPPSDVWFIGALNTTGL